MDEVPLQFGKGSTFRPQYSANQCANLNPISHQFVDYLARPRGDQVDSEYGKRRES